MDNMLALTVILILTILGSAIIMSEAIARLTAAVATIGVGVARLGDEVAETAAAIRAHLTNDTGISQTDLLAQVDKLDAAGAAINDAANQLNSLQSELGEPDDAPSDDLPAAGVDVPAAGDTGGLGDQPAPAVDPAVTGDTGGLGDDGNASFGNQNGIGSEMEQDTPGAIDTGRPPSDGEADSSSVTDGEADSSSVTGGDAPADDNQGFSRQ